MLPILERLRTNWEVFASTRKFALVKDAIEAGLAKVGKWYKDIRKNDMVFVCLGMYIIDQCFFEVVLIVTLLCFSLRPVH